MNRKTIFALGFFDGVHLGHQALLAACRQLAQANQCRVGAITFDSHPQSLFLPDPPPLINTNDDRDALLAQYGVEQILHLPVTKEVMSTYWRDFLDGLLEHGAAGFVCGDDFRFGCGGEGDGEKLAQYCREKCLPLVILPEQSLDGVRIASSHIRRLLENGQVEEADRFLGHDHILTAQVVSGRHLGRTIGTPTANMRIPQGVVMLRHGVYQTSCCLDGKVYTAVTNIGARPTVGGHEVRAESWILDFSGDLYDREITLHFERFLRPEQKFASLEALQAQIQLDAQAARKRKA